MLAAKRKIRTNPDNPLDSLHQLSSTATPTIIWNYCQSARSEVIYMHEFMRVCVRGANCGPNFRFDVGCWVPVCTFGTRVYLRKIVWRMIFVRRSHQNLSAVNRNRSIEPFVAATLQIWKSAQIMIMHSLDVSPRNACFHCYRRCCRLRPFIVRCLVS